MLIFFDIKGTCSDAFFDGINKKVTTALKIGIIGCGDISRAYLTNAPLFPVVSVTACADIDESAARRRAETFGIQSVSVDNLFNHPDIDVILNLTTPNAHFDVSMRAVQSGKHLYTEKPLTTEFETAKLLLAAAAKNSVSVASAPDTFLGAAGRCARQFVEDGRIGEIVSGTAFMMGRGMEHVHPNPSFYYQQGAGPIMDMGPYYLTMLVSLLGGVRRVQATSARAHDTRTISAKGPNAGTQFKVGIDTSVHALLEFHSGAIVTFAASWDVYRHSNAFIELHGTKGSLQLPDPDTFGGIVRLSEGGRPWEEIELQSRPFGAVNWPPNDHKLANYRMLGLADFAVSVRKGTLPRASGALAVHVLEVMQGILKASDTDRPQIMETHVERPRVLSEHEAEGLLLA